MQTTKNKINFKGQNIYVGIDSHLKDWKVTIMTETLSHKTFSQDPKPSVLANYLRKHFPGANYYSAYEASFCGFGPHRELLCLGIKNIVVNPADIPTTDKEKKQKEDKRDSRKIAKALKAGDLNAIYVPSKENEELRSLVRYRKTLVKDIGRGKNRIKSCLYFHGVKIPKEHCQASKYWSNRFTSWIKATELSTYYGTRVLHSLLEDNLLLRKNLLQINREIRKASRDGKYEKTFRLLASIPGIALVTAMTIISELENINRFGNLDKLCSYVGFVPTTNSTSDNEKTGKVTPRANRALRECIIESAWVAARTDPALSLAFNELCKRMKPSRAIIRIAKKLLNRVRHVLKTETEYEYSIIS
jgi:transposase